MTAALLNPPAVEPVSLGEVKAHLRLMTSTEDDLISALIVAARIHVERLTRRVLIAQDWRIYADAWPDSGIFVLPLAPVAAITSIILYGASGLPVTLSAADYIADIVGVPARIRLTGSGPATVGRALNGVEIDVTAGYGVSGLYVPQPLRLAIMMLATRWYEARDGAFVGTVPATIADAFEALIAPYRVMRL